MRGHYIIKKSTAAQPFHFVLRADNNQVILTSENYASKQSAQGGIASCQINSQVDSRYERKNSPAAQSFSFVLKAANGEPIGRSESYASEAGRDSGIVSVKANGKTADIRDEAK